MGTNHATDWNSSLLIYFRKGMMSEKVCSTVYRVFHSDSAPPAPFRTTDQLLYITIIWGDTALYPSEFSIDQLLWWIKVVLCVVLFSYYSDIAYLIPWLSLKSHMMHYIRQCLEIYKQIAVWFKLAYCCETGANFISLACFTVWYWQNIIQML